jgi:hypothetical protein
MREQLLELDHHIGRHRLEAQTLTFAFLAALLGLTPGARPVTVPLIGERAVAVGVLDR